MPSEYVQVQADGRRWQLEAATAERVRMGAVTAVWVADVTEVTT
jgi:hypothetical protein